MMFALGRINTAVLPLFFFFLGLNNMLNYEWKRRASWWKTFIIAGFSRLSEIVSLTDILSPNKPTSSSLMCVFTQSRKVLETTVKLSGASPELAQS